jgi:hypothetical protein
MKQGWVLARKCGKAYLETLPGISVYPAMHILLMYRLILQLFPSAEQSKYGIALFRLYHHEFAREAAHFSLPNSSNL